ncbi:hypothetical protein KV102_13045 [Mumia sp. zg.B53]|uniref:hypothetical protein n=1 Tax=unclassified Mumia TaxID=2621872 RepID=UPI001C6E5110|nr:MULTISPECIES: hypothetical protein [unclassified Mumia]MBW9206519.1 hypothetical protein [Mumia sp. zg.B17]MBW9211191.1 hypothetical protein [Mumia sp. zg.B21]MBW9215765.1 hypothetical protein [Mumia sp. zg.B53]MDD9349258.1 hypothetical protein [Mumia sp.]
MVAQDKMWHVTLTVAGTPFADEAVRSAMLRLRDEHAFLHSLRYDVDRAEICYWEQAPDMLDVAAMAMRVWSEHRDSAGLPPWAVVGLEILERDTRDRRSRAESPPAVGMVAPVPVHF